jgi:GIY-YIG catalytic domain
MAISLTLREVGPGEKRLDGGIMIYALADPETQAIRYIGQTSTPARRLKQHLRSRGKSDTSNINLWLASLRGRGLAPRMLELEIVDDGDAGEVRWVAHYHGQGVQLINMNSGGSSLEQCSRGRWANIKGGRHSPLHRAVHNLATGLASIRRSGDPVRIAWAEAKYASAMEAITRGERLLGRQAFRDYMNLALLERRPELGEPR